VNARGASESLDGQTRVIGKREPPCGRSRRDSLETRILLEGASCFLGFGHAKLAGGSHRDTERIEQIAKFPKFTLIVRGDDEAVAAPKAKASAHALPLEDCQLLQIKKFTDALFCKGGEFGHALLGKDSSFGSRLDFDDHALAGEDKIRVCLCFGVLGIIEIQHWLTLANPA